MKNICIILAIIIIISFIGCEKKNNIIRSESEIVLITDLSDELIQAVEDNNLIEVERLVVEGANVNLKNNDTNTILMWAVYLGHTEIVEVLIDAGANVNIQTINRGETALIMAVVNGYFDIVELLIVAGTDVNLKTNDGFTALSLADNQGYTEIVELLKTAGAVE